jgi:RNA polymerase sigma-54 factor
VQPVIPDVIVRASPEGAWNIELNTETLPRVLINNQYLAKVSSSAARTEDKLYLSECQANATWLVKSLDQRAKTILKVAREIVRQQDAFLVLGVQHLRPLNLKTVADAIEMHESTVSRVTSNKYMATPRGIFELKYFFTTAIASSDLDGDAHSAEAVRHRIKELVAAEEMMSCPMTRLLKNSGRRHRDCPPDRCQISGIIRYSIFRAAPQGTQGPGPPRPLT